MLLCRLSAQVGQWAGYWTLPGGDLRPEVNGTTDLCQWVSRVDMDQLNLVDLAKVGIKLVAHQL